MQELILGIALFTMLIMVLTMLILIIRSRLFATESIKILINAQKTLEVAVGQKLLDVLTNANLQLPAACGGRGTCGQCKITVIAGGGVAKLTETALLNKVELNAHTRLACQIVVKQDMEITLAEEIFGVKKWSCTLISCRNVSTFIKELVLELPEGEIIDFRAGSYVMVGCPPYKLTFRDLVVDEIYQSEWERYGLWRFSVESSQSVARAYSMANCPEQNHIIMLNVRVALPPPGSEPTIQPGVVSSYLFSLKPGDHLSVSGPYGNFFATDSGKEMVFIAGGAGMAPMRSHILDQLLRIKTQRPISFWYGARSRQELFYENEFTKLENEYDNFRWRVSLSEPKPEDQWTGYTGLIHKVVYDNYLKDHPAPELCEYYVCGPPLMSAAVLKMLDDLGAEKQDILLDNFGS